MSNRRRMMMRNRGSDIPKNCLRFIALEPGTFTFFYGNNMDVRTNGDAFMQYSVNRKEWVRLNFKKGESITTPTVKVGDIVYWMGYHGSLGKTSSTSYCLFSSTGKFNMSGDIRSIIDVSTMGGDYLYGASYGFTLNSLFIGSKIVDASKLILPPAYYMQAYGHMFENCIHMVYPPKVLGPNRTVIHGSGIGRNTDAVFQGCTSLVRSPRLLAENGKLQTYEYNVLFGSCSSLKRIEMLATDISETGCLNTWVSGVPNTSDGILVKHIDATWEKTGNSGVPSNWKVIYLNPATEKYYLSDKTTECDENGNVINQV